MSTNKTENLNLHAWEPEDGFLLSEFNENFSAIDAAVGALAYAPKFQFGSYVGNGKAVGQSGPATVLTFDFEPKIFVIEPYPGTAVIWWRGVTHAPTSAYSMNNMADLTWEGNTLTISGSDVHCQLTYQNQTYHWCAIA